MSDMCSHFLYWAHKSLVKGSSYRIPIKYGYQSQARNKEIQGISAAITASFTIISVICSSLKPNSASIDLVCCP